MFWFTCYIILDTCARRLTCHAAEQSPPGRGAPQPCPRTCHLRSGTGPSSRCCTSASFAAIATLAACDGLRRHRDVTCGVSSIAGSGREQAGGECSTHVISLRRPSRLKRTAGSTQLPALGYGGWSKRWAFKSVMPLHCLPCYYHKEAAYTLFCKLVAAPGTLSAAQSRGPQKAGLTRSAPQRQTPAALRGAPRRRRRPRRRGSRPGGVVRSVVCAAAGVRAAAGVCLAAHSRDTVPPTPACKLCSQVLCSFSPFAAAPSQPSPAAGPAS